MEDGSKVRACGVAGVASPGLMMGIEISSSDHAHIGSRDEEIAHLKTAPTSTEDRVYEQWPSW